MNERLSRWGHELVAVVAGKHSARSLPEFVERAFPVPVHQLPSLGFVFRENRGVDLPATFRRAVGSLRTYRNSMRRLREVVRETQPDLVVNFFEPLTGLVQLVRPLPVPVLAIGHQFMVLDPDFVRCPGRRLEQLGLKLFIRLVGCGSSRLALAFLPTPDLPKERWSAAPPLLRGRLFELDRISGSYLLIYVLNHGYSEEILAWHREHPDVEVHCFYDRPGAPAVEEVESKLTFHQLDGEKFLRMMAGCRAVACTAGFESVSEAAWLGKPLLVVPVEHHLEQVLNALDVARAGLGIADTSFELDRLLYAEIPDNRRFREWVIRSDEIVERAIRDAGRLTPRARAAAARESAAPAPAG